MLDLAAVAYVLVFAAVNALAGSQQAWLWVLLAFFYPMCNIAYTVMSRTLPLELSGRANTALNLGNFVGAFVLQWGLGIGVDALRASGWGVAEAYRVTFALLLALQAAGVTWMFVAGSGRHAAGSTGTPGR
jgi:hypothetical protein